MLEFFAGAAAAAVSTRVLQTLHDRYNPPDDIFLNG